MPKRAILAPLLGQLHRALLQISGMFLELAFKSFEERNRVGGRAGKTGDNLVVVKPPRLPRGVLHHMIAHGHLAISDKHGLIVLAHAQNRSAMHLGASLAVMHRTIIQRCPALGTQPRSQSLRKSDSLL